jgi:GH24 family phage-related lysozyme (muramidase)
MAIGTDMDMFKGQRRVTMTLIESIKKHEGFRAKPYPDPIRGWDVPTFGHGLTYITEAESAVLVENRIREIRGGGLIG